METGDLDVKGIITGITSEEVTTALTYTPSKQASTPTAGDIATVDASGNVTDSFKQFTSDTTFSADSDSLVPTQKAIKTYADNLLSVASALTYKGTIDASTSPNYPAGNVGDVYTFSASGFIGGVGGYAVTMGDLLICNTTNAGGTQASVGSDWDKIQLALNGIVLGPSISNNNDFVTFNGTSGTVVQDSGLSLSTDGTMASDSDTLIPSQKSVKTYVDTGLSGKVSTTVTVNGHALTSNVTVSASDLTTGTLPHSQLPTLYQADITSLVASGKTVMFNNSITFAGTDSTTMTFPGTSDTVVVLGVAQTLTNKRITKRTTLSSGSAITFTPTSDTVDIYEFATTASAGTLTVVNPTGTPTDGQALVLRVKSTNVMNYAWGTSYRFSTMVPSIVSSSGSSLTDYISFIYNATDSKWDIAGVSNGH